MARSKFRDLFSRASDPEVKVVRDLEEFGRRNPGKLMKLKRLKDKRKTKNKFSNLLSKGI